SQDPAARFRADAGHPPSRAVETVTPNSVAGKASSDTANEVPVNDPRTAAPEVSGEAAAPRLAGHPTTRAHPEGDATTVLRPTSADHIDALREREAQYRALAALDPDGIVVMDDSSIILSVNRAMQTIFGYTEEELIGRELTMLMPESLREAHRRGVQRYLETGERTMSWTSVQVPGRRKDGSEVHLEINFGEYSVDGRHRFVGFIRDVTERKRAEEELRFQTTLLAAQNEAAIDG